MKTLVGLIILLVASVSFGADYNAILYVNSRTPQVSAVAKEHWKPLIPDVGVGEVIRDFKVLGTFANKMLVHAMLPGDSEDSGQVAEIQGYVRDFNGCEAPVLHGSSCSKPMALQIFLWVGLDVNELYLELWDDRDLSVVFGMLAEETLNYPVVGDCDGEPCGLIVTVKEAEDTYGATIERDKLLTPHKFYGK